MLTKVIEISSTYLRAQLKINGRKYFEGQISVRKDLNDSVCDSVCFLTLEPFSFVLFPQRNVRISLPARIEKISEAF
jgi:hypothetical protein